MDSTSKKKYRVAKQDMAEVSGEREERPVLKLINYMGMVQQMSADR